MNDDLPDVPFCGILTAGALQRSYEQERIAWRLAHPLIDVKAEAKLPKCKASPDHGPHEISWDWQNKPVCKFCYAPWSKC